MKKKKKRTTRNKERKEGTNKKALIASFMWQ